ncbi:MAG: hypothetical protein PHC70_02800 [Patescibacteria group bacterium]|nr:hypothetical protein [Patescibacteria group bacterium]
MARQAQAATKLGPQKIKPPLTKAMDLHAAQNEAWRERARNYEGLPEEEGLGLSSSGFESELGGSEEGTPALPVQFGQFYNPLEQRRPSMSEPEYLGPGSMATEPEDEEIEEEGGTPASDVEMLSQFQAKQKQAALAEEQLTGAPSAMGAQSRQAQAGKTQEQPEASKAKRPSETGAPGKTDEVSMALKLLSNQANQRLQGQQMQQKVQDFKDRLEKLNKAKQTFKNLFDVGEIGASESIVPIFTLWAEWNIDLINKHVADGKIPMFEQKPGEGALPFEKTLSQVKDGITILADILIPVSVISSLMLPLVLVALIVVSMFGVFLSIVNAFNIHL